MLTAERVLDGQFMKDVDLYVSDHFPGRHFFVGLDAYYALYTGRNGSNGIYQGKDGYLLTKPVEAGPRLTQNLLAIRNFSEDTGLPVTMMVAPSAGFIYQELLPMNHDVYRDGEILSEMQKAIQKPFESGADAIRWVVLIGPYQEAKKNREAGNTAETNEGGGKESGDAMDGGLYYKTDHHWTSLGAYIAYREVGRALGFTPLEPSDFVISTYDGFYGTSYAKSAYWLTDPDQITLWESRRIDPEAISVEIFDDDREEVIRSDSMFFQDRLSESDMYQVFLDGNHSMVRIENQSAPEGKLLIIKDSYGHTIAPFLANHYREIYMVDLRYYRRNPVSQLIAEQGIDQVLFVYSLSGFVSDQNFIWLK